jgi:hypothetical protein
MFFVYFACGLILGAILCFIFSKVENINRRTHANIENYAKEYSEYNTPAP